MNSKQERGIIITNQNNSLNAEVELTGEPNTDFINMVSHNLKEDYNITEIYFDNQNKLNLTFDKELDNSNIKMIYATLDTLDDVSNIYSNETKSLNVSIDYINGSKKFKLEPNKQDELTSTGYSSVTTFPDENIMLSSDFETQNILLPLLVFSFVVLACVSGFALKKYKVKK